MFSIIAESLYKKKGRFTLIIIQFVIGFIALIFGLSNVNGLLQYEKDVKKVFTTDDIQLYIEEEFDDSMNGMSFDEAQKIEAEKLDKMKMKFEKLKKVNGIEKCALFESIDMTKNKCEEITHEKVANSEEKNKKCILACNKDFLEIIKWKLESGSMDEILNYNISSDIIPAVISSAFNDTYSMGNTYTVQDYLDNEYKIKIVGVLDKSFGIHRGDVNSSTDEFKKNNEIIIMPKLTENRDICSYTSNCFVRKNDKKDIKELQKEIENIFNDDKTTISIRTIQSQIDEQYKGNKSFIYIVLGFASVILGLSLLGCVGTVLSNILSRKKEFGIYFSLGCTKKDIEKIVIGEIGFIFALSFFVASIIDYLCINVWINIDAYIVDAGVLFVTFMIMAVCVLLCILAPIRRIAKFQPVNLLNGKDS